MLANANPNFQFKTHKTEKRTAVVKYRENTINLEERTIEFTLATDAVADFGGYFEVLGMEDGELRTQRLDEGIVPILDSHPQAQWKTQTIDDHFGLIVEWRKENGEIIGKLSFAEDERSDRAWKKVSTKKLKTGSIGYLVYKHRNISGPEDKKPTYRAIDWEILEFSLVSIPRDPNAQSRSHSVDTIDTIIENENPTLNERTQSMSQVNQPSVDPKTRTFTQDELDNQVKENQQRILDIQAAVKNAGFEPAFALELIAKGISFEAASKEILKKVAERNAATEASEQVTPALDINHPAEDTKREARIKAMASAIVFRADTSGKVVLPEDAREFVNLNLFEMARKSLSFQGKDARNLEGDQLIRAALQTTSDFPAITGAAMNMSVKRGYDTIINNYEPLVSHTSRTNFQEGGSISLSDAPQLKKLNEHGELKKGTFEESVEKYKIETLGVEVGITRQTFYNDQFNVFGKVPFSLGVSGARSVKRLVWGILKENRKMFSDNKTLFHTDHLNVLAAPVAELDKAALAALRLLLRKQKTPKKEIMDLNPGYLVVSAELEEAGRALLAQIYPANTKDVNVFKDDLQGLIVEGSLDENDFFLTGRKEEVDMIELAWLNNKRGVNVQEVGRDGFLGIKWNVWMDVGGAPLDFRGLYKGTKQSA